MRYRRDYTLGGTWFFTVNLFDRSQALLTEHIELLRASVQTVKARHPFNIDAIVVLPDHLHMIWTLPEGDSDYSMRMGLIKANFSKVLPLVETRAASRVVKGERGIWQRRFWEHRIRDEKDFEHHVAYIHNNPVKHGYVQKPRDWPYSSIHRYISHGLINEDWSLPPDHNKQKDMVT